MNKICVVSLDLHFPLKTYDRLDRRLQEMNFQKLQSHLWAGHTQVPALVVKETLVAAVQPGDSVFVFSHDLWAEDHASFNSL
jgi:hypothetical protein